MRDRVGIRREDKSRWERRVPLVPWDAGRIAREDGLRFTVQPSPIRVYTDAEFAAAGADVAEDLAGCGLVMAVKEIPVDLLQPGRTYAFFSHTAKAQPHNMRMLARLMDLGCTLVDYELIVDGDGRRTVFFGFHAGLAGMGETLVALGQRLAAEGIESPFQAVRPPHEFNDLEAYKASLRAIGAEISAKGLPASISPLVFGFAGYGNVARGAWEILDCLPVIEIPPEDLPGLAKGGGASARHVYKVVFKEEHSVEPKPGHGPFATADYFAHPERYQGTFTRWLPHIDVLVNCIYWTSACPRILSLEDARALAAAGRPRLRVVGDISCDIAGGIELTVKATQPDVPCFTVDPATGAVTDGDAASGITVMAVDNLPCELPREASMFFSRALRDLVPPLVRAELATGEGPTGLPRTLDDAVIVRGGKLTPRFAHLESHAAPFRGH